MNFQFFEVQTIKKWLSQWLADVMLVWHMYTNQRVPMKQMGHPHQWLLTAGD
jgi:hypothetical protein